jgi:hypothetical protein
MVDLMNLEDQVDLDFTHARRRAWLVYLQNRFQVMSYSGDHETSHLCSYTFEKGARGSA